MREQGSLMRGSSDSMDNQATELYQENDKIDPIMSLPDVPMKDYSPVPMKPTVAFVDATP